jgi:hypothetical protein
MQGITTARTEHVVKQSGGAIATIVASNIVDGEASEQGGTFDFEKGPATLTLSNWSGPGGRQVVGLGAAAVLRRGEAFVP